jgi:hypothetical protein
MFTMQQSCAQRPGDATPIVESKLFLKDYKSYYKSLNKGEVRRKVYNLLYGEPCFGR